MKDIKNKGGKINNILNLSAEERYFYFIRKIADFEIVWGLFNKGWAVLGDSQNNEIIPFWPEREFAEVCAVESWDDYVPKAIPLSDFRGKWLLGMIEDKKQAGVFYTPQGKGIIVEPLKLKNDIENELEQYN